MGFLVLIILTGVVIAIVASSSRGNKNYSGYHGGYVHDYDEDDYETSAARGDRDYFSDDPARDYNSYYAQVADAADMGDQDAIDEMRGEFGEGEW